MAVEPDGDRTGSRGILVVGAGRSGTSAITRGLQALGVALGDDLKAPTDKNPTGFFEDRELLRIAKGARRVLGLRTESVSLIAAERWLEEALDPLRMQAVECIERRFCGYPLWGFKYAQILRMLPFWEGIAERAGIKISFVVALRNPLSVARSRAKLDPLRGLQEKSDLEWLVNVVPYFRHVARYPFVVVDYDLLMSDPAAQLQRLARSLEISLDAAAEKGIQDYVAAFLTPGMRHSQYSEQDLMCDPRLNGLTRDAYRWLRKLATDDLDSRDKQLWNDWARIEGELAALAPVLRHVDYLEARARASRADPISALWARLTGRRAT